MHFLPDLRLYNARKGYIFKKAIHAPLQNTSVVTEYDLFPPRYLCRMLPVEAGCGTFVRPDNIAVRASCTAGHRSFLGGARILYSGQNGDTFFKMM